MPEALQGTDYAWRVISHLGSSSLMMPILVITATSLWHSQQKAAVRIWLLGSSLAVIVTLATKIAFYGWGIGIASLNFTGISGHTLLATSILPVLFEWVLARNQSNAELSVSSYGLLVGAGVGISRVVLGAHSMSEVLVAWIAGLAVSGVTLRALKRPVQRPRLAWLSPLILLLALNTTTSTYLPTHDWEVRIALLLSGHDRPYTRQHDQPGTKRHMAAYATGRTVWFK